MINCDKCGFSPSKNTFIANLQLRLQYEKMKNKIYENIIHTFTNIKVNDIISESNNEVNIYNFSNGNIPIIVNDFIKSSSSCSEKKVEHEYSKQSEPESKKYILESTMHEVKKKKKKKHIITENNIMSENELVIEEDDEEIRGIQQPELHFAPQSVSNSISTDTEASRSQKFRRVKEYIKTSEKELDTKLKEDVVRVEKELEEIVYNNFDVSYKEITESIENLFGQIQNARVYTTNLSTMKNTRRKLLGKLNLQEYTELLSSHIKRLEDIFTLKNHPKKKINQIIQSSLTPLDTRLVYYEGYTNVAMDTDEVQKFNLVLGVLVQHEKHFIPYNKTIFYNNIKNYGLSLFELQECIEKCIINRYGFHNIIYLDRNKSKLDDPYSFYVLTSVKDNRYWKMECRLEDFTNDFIDNILPYCINLFKKIYKDVFSDNVYRADYTSKSQIMEFDCQQLLENIICLAKSNSLCKMFQHIIKSNCTFTSTETDKFNLYGDDKLQQKRFSNLKDTDEDVCKVLKRLFDNLNSDDAIKLLHKKS